MVVDNKWKALLAFGSTSDAKKLLVNKKLIEIVDSEEFNKYIDFYLSIGSAHRTPETVKEHAKFGVTYEFSDVFAHAKNCRDKPINTFDVVIAGAGLSNALISAYMVSTPGEPIFIGLPVSDTRTNGISSLLSTQEMPPGCPIGCVGIDKVDAAANIALKIASNKYKAAILYNSGVYRGNETSDLSKKLNKLCVPFTESDQLTPEDISGSLVLFPYQNTEAGPFSGIPFDKLVQLDEYSGNNSGLVIASYCGLYSDGFLREYTSNMNKLNNTLHVRFGGLENMAILAAKIIAKTTNDDKIREKIKADYQEGLGKYKPFRKIIKIKTGADCREIIKKC